MEWSGWGGWMGEGEEGYRLPSLSGAELPAAIATAVRVPLLWRKWPALGKAGRERGVGHRREKSQSQKGLQLLFWHYRDIRGDLLLGG